MDLAVAGPTEQDHLLTVFASEIATDSLILVAGAGNQMVPGKWRTHPAAKFA